MTRPAIKPIRWALGQYVRVKDLGANPNAGRVGRVVAQTGKRVSLEFVSGERNVFDSRAVEVLTASEAR